MTKIYLLAVLAGYACAEKHVNKDGQISINKSDGPGSYVLTCVDTNYDSFGNEIGDSYGDVCSDYYDNTGWCGSYNTDTFNNEEMCCACGGGDEQVDMPESSCNDANYDANDNEIGDSYGDVCSQYWGNEHWCGNYDTDAFNSYSMCCACSGEPGNGGTCENTNYDSFGNVIGDSYGDVCSDYIGNAGWCGSYSTETFNNEEMCCACGGGSDPNSDTETVTPPVILPPGQCTDTNFDAQGNVLGDSYGDVCSQYVGNSQWCGNYETDTFNSLAMCCECGGGCTGDECDITETPPTILIPSCEGTDCDSEDEPDEPFTLDDLEVAIEVMDTIKSDLVTGDHQPMM